MEDNAGRLLSPTALTGGVLKSTSCIHPHGTPPGNGQELNLQQWGLNLMSRPLSQPNWMTIQEVVVNHLRIHEALLLDSPICLLPTAWYLSLRVLVWLLHCENMTWNPIKLPWKGIAVTNFPVLKLQLDLISVDVLGPVPLFLDKSRSKEAFLLQFNNALKNTKSWIKNNDFSGLVKGLGEMN